MTTRLETMGLGCAFAINIRKRNAIGGSNTVQRDCMGSLPFNDVCTILAEDRATRRSLLSTINSNSRLVTAVTVQYSSSAFEI